MDQTDVLTYQTNLADYNKLMGYMRKHVTPEAIDDSSLIEPMLPLWIHLSHLCDDVSEVIYYSKTAD